MKRGFIQTFSVIFISLLSFAFGQPVFAHGDEPRLEISAERLNPGAVLEIRGVDFEFEEQVQLALISPQMELPLGTATGDAEGVFLFVISLPADLAAGTYVVHATTDDHVVESPQITVWGAAQPDEGGQDARDEADGLLAPMPTFALDFSATPAPELTALETSASKPKSNTVIYSISAAFGIISLLGIRMLRKA